VEKRGRKRHEWKQQRQWVEKEEQKGPSKQKKKKTIKKRGKSRMWATRERKDLVTWENVTVI